jgi:sortase A
MTSLASPPVTAGPAPTEPGARPRRPLWLTTPLWALASASLLALWFAAYVLVIGAAQEGGDQQRSFARFRSQLSQATAPLGPSGQGRPVALLDVPAAGITRTVVSEGVTSKDLQSGPGHRRDSVLPGQVGTSVLYGRSATFGAPFKHLYRLRAGDVVRVTTGQGSFVYTVTRTRHAGDVDPAPQPGTGKLTLVSLTGSGWRSGFAPTRTTYVDATLQQAVPSTGRQGQSLVDEQVLSRAHDGLLVLVLWLTGLLVVVVGSVLAWSRWGRWQSWVVASPVLVAVLVGCSRSAAVLLPNLL